MIVYRIAKSAERARDLSGFGSFKFGGRWNNKGAYMLYTSMNSSLAFLENLVHFDESNIPPGLYVTTLEIIDDTLIYQLPDGDYPANWQSSDNAANKTMGDEWMQAQQYLAFKIRSVVNPLEFNFLLNSHFPRFNDLVKITSINELAIDSRLIR